MNERERLKLYDRLGQVLGSDDAGTLMELLPPNGWDDIATKDFVAANATMLRGEMAEVRGEMAEVRGEMAELRSDMTAGFADVRSEIADLGSSLHSEIAAMQRSLFIALAGFMLTVWLTLIFAT